MIEVRPAEPSDADAIREVARASWHAAYDDLLGEGVVERTVDEWYAIEELRESIDHPEHLVRVAGNGIAGFAHAGPNPRDERVAELLRLYVRPERWGEGTGGRLLDAVEADLTGYDRLELSVLADNEIGIAFYEKRGFDRTGQRDVEIEGESYREYRYERSL